MHLKMKLEGLSDEMVDVFKDKIFEAVEWKGDNYREAQELLSGMPLILEEHNNHGFGDIIVKGTHCRVGDYIVLMKKSPMPSPYDPGLIRISSKKEVNKHFDIIEQPAQRQN